MLRKNNLGMSIRLFGHLRKFANKKKDATTAMNPCPNYISESILFRITRYGEQKYDCYMAEAADVNRILDHGKIPLLQLPINADGPVVAILPAVEKHQDRLEPDYAIPEFYIKAIVQNGGCPVPVGFDKTVEQLEIIQPQAILLP
mgnify:FL=1